MPRQNPDTQVTARVRPEVAEALSELTTFTRCSRAAVVAAGIASLRDQLRDGQTEMVRARVAEMLRIPSPGSRHAA